MHVTIRMKSVICVGFLVIFFATISFASTAVGLFADPKHPGKCVITENLILSPGQEIKDPDADCGRIICGPNSFAEFQKCGLQYADGCTFGDYIDTRLPYPECCKRELICK